jgi:protocatechuate 3,4-dioxygenase beta subunit
VEPEQGPAPREGELLGRVVSEPETPVAQAELLLERELTGWELPPPGRTARTGSDGRFRFADLEAGARYRLRAQHPDWAPALRRGIRIEWGRGTRLPDLDLSAGGSVEVRVESADGQAIAGAIVEALAGDFASGPARRGAEPEVLRSAVTGNEGRARLERLPPGLIGLRARARGFQAETRDTISVQDLKATEGIELRLRPGAAIAGTVRDPEGKPIEGARVAVSAEANRPEMSPGTRWRWVPATTDAEGRYRLDGVPGGELTVDVRAPGFQRNRRPRVIGGSEGVDFALARRASISGTVVDAATGARVEEFTARIPVGSWGDPPPWEFRKTGAGAFTLTGGLERQVEVRVEAPGYAPWRSEGVQVPDGGGTVEVQARMLRGAAVRGSAVKASTLEPVTQGTVLLLAGQEPRPENPAQPQFFWGNWMVREPLQRAALGPDGAWRFERVASGWYEVLVRAPGFAPARKKALRLDEGGALDGIEVQLSAGGTLRGRVTWLDGTPAAAAVVLIVGNQGGPDSAESATTDDDGRYASEHLTPGSWNVRVQDDSEVQGEMGFRPMMPGGEPVEIRDGEAAVKDFVLHRGTRLVGSVTTREGPATGWSVQAWPLSPAPGQTPTGAHGRTDHRGEYVLKPALRAGEYTVRFHDVEDPTTQIMRKVQIQGEESQRLDVAVASGEIEGIVQDAATHAPVQQVSVQLTREGDESPRSTATDEQGRFRFRRLEPGDWMLVARAHGYTRPPGSRVTVPDGKLSGVLLPISRGLTLQGRVIDAGGGPVAGVRVRARAEGAEDLRAGQTTPDGRYRFATCLSQAVYRVSFERAGGATEEREVDLRNADAVTELDVTLPR